MPVRSRLPITVRTYEFDALNTIPPAVFLQWMQDAAILASAENGFPALRYRELGTAWVLSDILLEVYDHPQPGQELEVETWVADFGAARSHRQYRVLTDEGSLLAAGQALWAYVNIESRRPQRLDKELRDAFALDPERAPEDPEWGTELLREKDGETDERTHTVRWSELDGAFHVNNTVYATWVVDHLAVNDLGSPDLSDKGTDRIRGYGPGNIKRLRLSYRRSAVLGETVTWKLRRLSGTATVQEVADADDQTIAQAAVLLG